MEQEFWESRWTEGKIGFHLGHAHRSLSANLDLFRGKQRVLVPLAGKSFDVDALAEVADAVYANEFIEQAARAWFAERSFEATQAQAYGMKQLTHDGVSYLVGDFFTLEAPAAFDAAFDRAALVAIDPANRARYVDVLRRSLRPGAVLLLIVFEYDTSKLSGPPFSIDEATVRSLFADGFSVERLGDVVEPAGERFQEAGITSLLEAAYRIVRS